MPGVLRYLLIRLAIIFSTITLFTLVGFSQVVYEHFSCIDRFFLLIHISTLGNFESINLYFSSERVELMLCVSLYRGVSNLCRGRNLVLLFLKASKLYQSGTAKAVSFGWISRKPHLSDDAQDGAGTEE